MPFRAGRSAAHRAIAFRERPGVEHGMKLPRDVSGGEAVKALRRLGFEVTRQYGSHIRMSQDVRRVPIPNHRTIHPKILQSALRQAGVGLEEFVVNL